MRDIPICKEFPDSITFDDNPEGINQYTTMLGTGVQAHLAASKEHIAAAVNHEKLARALAKPGK